MQDDGATRASLSSKFGSTGPPIRSAPVVSRAHHQLQPVRRGNFVVVDHQEMVAAGKVASAVSKAALIAWQLP